MLLACHLVTSHATASEGIPPSPVSDVSLRHEVQHAIDRGLSWLLAHQDSAGWWSTADHPAVTALVLSGFLGEPTERYRTNPPPALTNAIAYLVGSSHPDGSLHRGTLINYNTAITATTLALANQPEHRDLLLRARAFLIHSQNDFGEPGKLDTPLDGGVGYGDKNKHSDLNNTLVALEALRATEHLGRDRLPANAPELNWAAAIQFIQSCQNLPSHNAQPWVSTSPDDRGGFVYFPGHSMAGGVTNSVTGRVALRSYGSISYAGLLSYVYARLERNDPRVIAVLDWLRAHYTLEENPGMGQQGLFYYLHLMTKALNSADTPTLELEDGRQVIWRREVALRLLNLQQADGSWVNPNNRWWEKDPNLVTAYAVMTLDILWRGL
jgi:squalene-hopene/tetraprenyl-beta-curcumene cyclase